MIMTIGFGDFNLANSPVPIKGHSIYLKIAGTGGYALGLGLIVNA